MSGRNYKIRIKEFDLLGCETIMSGYNALLLLESAACEALSGCIPAQAEFPETNLFGRKIMLDIQSDSVGFSGDGYAMSGLRSCHFVNSGNLSAALNMVQENRHYHCPQVYHFVDALGHENKSPRYGHEALFRFAEAGAVVLCAGNVQETIFLTLLAHRIAEQFMVPVVVGHEMVESMFRLQYVRVPAGHEIRTFLGAADDIISCELPVQKALFGKVRRRIVRWLSVDQPALGGVYKDRSLYGLSAASRHIFSPLPDGNKLRETAEILSFQTGINLSPVSVNRNRKSGYGLICMGAAGEVDINFELGQEKELAIFKTRLLHPFPVSDFCNAMNGLKAVSVLEYNPESIGNGPFYARVVQAFARASTNARFARQFHADSPFIKSFTAPAVYSVTCPQGFSELDKKQLEGIFHNMKEGGGGRPLLIAGVAQIREKHSFPTVEIQQQKTLQLFPEANELLLPGSSFGFQSETDIADYCIFLPEDNNETAELMEESIRFAKNRFPESLRGFYELERRFLYLNNSKTSGCNYKLAGKMFCTFRDLLLQPDICRKIMSGGVLCLLSPAEEQLSAEKLPLKIQGILRERGIRVFFLTLPETTKLKLGPEIFPAAFSGAFLAFYNEESAKSLSVEKLLLRYREVLEKFREPDKEEEILEMLKIVEAAAKKRQLLPLTENRFSEEEEQEKLFVTPEKSPQTENFGPLYARSSDFYGGIACLFQQGKEDFLTHSPRLGCEFLPPLSAAFINSPNFGFFPHFSPALCQACFKCIDSCPTGALQKMNVDFAALLKDAQGMAVKKGLEVTVLTPLLKQLAGNCQNLMAEGKGDNFAGLAKSALTMLLEKKNITGQKAEKLSLALDFVTEQTGVLPLAKGGDGKCFSIRVEKAYCNGCALCAKACAFNALCMRTEPLREAEDVPFTRTGQGLCPGGFSLPGRAFWQLLSDTLEEMVRPGITAFAQKISLLVEKIQNELRTVLDELERNERESVLEKLNALLFILQKGSTGRGRAPALILLWAGENFYEINNWPFNAFSQPVFVRSGQFSCPHLRAVTEAHFRHCLDNIRLFRKVSLEMEGNYKPAIHDAEIAALDWFDLSPEEAAFIPPVVMVTDRNQKQAELLKESVADLSWPVIILNPSSLENDFFGNYEKELRDWNYTRIKAEQDRPVVEKVVERRKNTLIQLEERRIALREKLMALCGYGTGAQEG